MKNLDLLRKPSVTKSLIEHYEYGKMPKPPKHLYVTNIESDRFFAAGKAELISAVLSFELEDGEWYELPIKCAMPRTDSKHPAFIHIKDDLNVPDLYQPTEELCDCGFTVLSIGVNSLLAEFSKKKRGMVRALRGSGRRNDTTGSLAIFAWCAMRAVEYLSAIDQIDPSRITVIGHGIYGTAALLAAAYDNRISAVISNSAGPSGVSDRTTVRGELFTLKQKRSDLFCKRFYKMSGKEELIPFNGDALISLIAPRKLLLDNASYQLSRCAESELSVAIIASECYEKSGARGLSAPKDIDICKIFAENKEISFMDGQLAYRCRPGFPYISREDWRVYIKWLSAE